MGIFTPRKYTTESKHRRGPMADPEDQPVTEALRALPRDPQPALVPTYTVPRPDPRVTVTRAMPAVPDRRPPTGPLPLGTPPALLFDKLAGEVSIPPGLLPCSRCGATWEDGDAGGWPQMIRRMRRTALDAGWDCNGYGAWCCPACLPPRNLPAVHGGMRAEVDMRVRAGIAAHAYEDLPREWRRWDRAERRRREVADSLGAWRVA